MKQSGYLQKVAMQRQQERHNLAQAVFKTTNQLFYDCIVVGLCAVLPPSQVTKALDSIELAHRTYVDAVNPENPEADVLQERLDKELKVACHKLNSDDLFVDFDERYPLLKKVCSDGKWRDEYRKD